MRNLTPVVCLLALSASFVTPAEANWFSNQKSNSMYNVGSVRNPTPQELRAFYAKQAAERQAREDAKK